MMLKVKSMFNSIYYIYYTNIFVDWFFLVLVERLYFIDFEYGSYSYRGYDIANHFNEYAGFDCDYSLYVCSLTTDCANLIQ